MRYGKLSLSLLGLTTLACIGPMAQADIITFEDLTGSGAFTTTYHGIDFEPGVWNYYDSVQPPYTPHSGVERTFQSGSEDNPFFTFVTPTEFQGIWVSGETTATAQLSLYDASNTLLATSGTVSGSDTPQFLASGYSGVVSKVVISTPSPDSIVFDDITLGPAAADTPEPGSLALLAGMGVSSAGFMARRRKQAKKAA